MAPTEVPHTESIYLGSEDDDEEEEEETEDDA